MNIELSIYLDNGREVFLNVDAREVDDGIGRYEFWGQKYVDNRKSIEVIKVTHDEDLTESERKEVEEYLESSEFQQKVEEIAINEVAWTNYPIF
jgi:hypothetical protein